MSPEKQRIDIAEACPSVFAVRQFSTGKTQIVWRLDNDTQGPVPTVDPLSDLNAMHAVEQTLSRKQRITYLQTLGTRVVASLNTDGVAALWAGTTATAAQRAEAFLRTLDLWTED